MLYSTCAVAWLSAAPVNLHTGAPADILGALQAAKDANEKVVVHCWGGGGRTGLVQAAWLMTEKGLSAEDAAAAVTAFAQTKGLSRRVDVEALKQFVADASRKSAL